jgi:hypothetical protein
VLKSSDFEFEQVRRWIRDKEHSRATGIYYMAQGILNELGEEEGTRLIIQQIRNMGAMLGESMRVRLKKKGMDNSLENRIKLSQSSENAVNVAWDRVSLDVSEDEFVIRFSSCPIAEGFKQHGDAGLKIGELFCSNIDDSVSKGYNPNLSCTRETSLNLDNVCTLRFRMRRESVDA